MDNLKLDAYRPTQMHFRIVTNLDKDGRDHGGCAAV